MEVIFCMLGIGGTSLFSYCWGWWNFCWVESHVSHIVGSRLEAHVSHMVWSWVEGHFLALLEVVGRKINFSILLGSGGKITFSHCWELSVIFLILLEVKSGWNVIFLMLLEVGGNLCFSYCWEVSESIFYIGGKLVESRFSHIVGNWWKAAFLILLEVGFLILLGVGGK